MPCLRGWNGCLRTNTGPRSEPRAPCTKRRQSAGRRSGGCVNMGASRPSKQWRPISGRAPMQPAWINHYPPGVPAQIDTAQYRSLIALMEESFAKFAKRTAYISMDKTLTYGQLDEQSKALGA